MTANRIILWAIIAVVAIYDGLSYLYGWQSISAGVRNMDTAAGGLIRWVWLALWIHFFVRNPWGGW